MNSEEDDMFDLGLEDLGDFVTITVEELILIVYDASGSMSESGSSGVPKYKEAEEATNGFIQRLQQSRAASSFYVAVAIFNNDVKEVLDTSSVLSLPAESPIQLPKPYGNTNLDSGLEWAEKKAEEFLSRDSDVESDARKIAIIVLSDGWVNRGADPKERGMKLANLYTVGAGAFGNAAEELLRDLVSSSDLFKKDPTPDDLRGLLERSSLIAMRN